MADNSFVLSPFDSTRDKPPRAGAGRPAGSKNKSRTVAWRMAEVETPAIMAKVIERAKRLKDDGDIRCAEIVLNRTLPRPRSAPVQIDISQQFNPQMVLAAMVAGDLTPSDAATLVRAIEGSVGMRPGVRVAADPRAALLARITRLIEHRNPAAGAAAVEVEPAPAEPAPCVDGDALVTDGEIVELLDVAVAVQNGNGNPPRTGKRKGRCL